MVEPLAEYTVRDYSAFDAQVAQIADRERVLTNKLKISNYRQLVILTGGTLLAIGAFLVLAAIAYRIAFPPLVETIETTKVVEKTVIPKIIIETPSGSLTKSGGVTPQDNVSILNDGVTRVTGPKASNIIDDVNKRLSNVSVSNSGASVFASLRWDNLNDLDLFIKEPNGNIIGYSNKISQSQGNLNVDANLKPSGATLQPIENISWPDNKAVKGKYNLLVGFYRRDKKEPMTGTTKFEVILQNQGKRHVYKGEFLNKLGRQKKNIVTFEVK
jgi:hypothetical protein